MSESLFSASIFCLINQNFLRNIIQINLFSKNGNQTSLFHKKSKRYFIKISKKNLPTHLLLKGQTWQRQWRNKLNIFQPGSKTNELVKVKTKTIHQPNPQIHSKARRMRISKKSRKNLKSRNYFIRSCRNRAWFQTKLWFDDEYSRGWIGFMHEFYWFWLWCTSKSGWYKLLNIFKRCKFTA